MTRGCAGPGRHRALPADIPDVDWPGSARRSTIVLAATILLAMVGSFSAIIAEYPNIRHIDDDFLMLFVPAICLLLAELVIAG